MVYTTPHKMLVSISPAQVQAQPKDEGYKVRQPQTISAKSEHASAQAQNIALLLIFGQIYKKNNDKGTILCIKIGSSKLK
jgi:hypothetical protein